MSMGFFKNNSGAGGEGSKISEKTIFINGAYGGPNAGDEAILDAIVTRCRSELDNPQLYVGSLDPEHTMTTHDVDKAFPAFMTRMHELFTANTIEWLQALRDSDELWIGGGGLIGTMNELRYCGMVLASRLSGTPVKIVANGATRPIDGTFRNQMMAFALNQTDVVTVRDKQSRANLQEINIEEPIDLVSDPVFSHLMGAQEPLPVDPTDKILVAPKWRGVASGRENSEIDIDGFSEALDQASRTLDSEVVFIPFNESRRPPDSSVGELIATEMDEDATVIEDELDFVTLSGMIAQAPLLVGMRLHSLIFAMKHRTPFVGIAYHEKCTALMEEVSDTTIIWSDDIFPHQLHEAIIERWQSDSFVEAIEDNVQRLEERSTTWFPLITSKRRSQVTGQFILLSVLFILESFRSVIQQLGGAFDG